MVQQNFSNLMTWLTFMFFATFNSCTDVKTKNTGPNKEVSVLTNSEKRKYFEDKIAFELGNRFQHEDTVWSFSHFMKTQYPNVKAENITDPLIYALEEEYINPSEIDSNRYWFRITVSPCFSQPYCLVLEKKRDKTYLSTKMTNGDGGYYCGTLDFSSMKVYPDSIYDIVSQQLHEYDFWNLGNDSVCDGGLDGESWTFEAIENGNYNIIYRWLPPYCGNDTTKHLGVLGLDLRTRSKMLAFLSIFHEMDRKELDSY